MSGKENIKRSGKAATSFGFQNVPGGERQGLVNDVFSSVANRYDIMNDVMSGGLHRLWKAHLMNRLRPIPGMALLDVAGGTGDIAFRFLEALGDNPASKIPKVTVCDINTEMLEVGRSRAMDVGFWKDIDWTLGNAEDLPFEADRFDVVTIAFGIRNVTHIEKAVQEAHRVLRPGGKYLVLEFSSTTVPMIKDIYDWYSFNVIPKIGKAIANDEDSYQYLVESIRKFPPPLVFEGYMKEAGFARVYKDQLAGGIVTLFGGWKV